MRCLKVGVAATAVFLALGIYGWTRWPAAQATNAPTLEVSSRPFFGPTRGFVVLDPGHGGSNLGAATVQPHVYEKHVTLAIAAELAPKLRQAGFDVALTRSNDTHLSLRQRTEIANQLGADLFVSLHANATETHSQRGFESFVLTRQALDVDARALRLATASPRSVDLATERLLKDVERGMSHSRAISVAAAIQTELRALRGSRHDRGVRQGDHHVLLGADMPAVLVEIGFVDHPIEGAQLIEPETRSEIAAALSRAIATELGS